MKKGEYIPGMAAARCPGNKVQRGAPAIYETDEWVAYGLREYVQFHEGVDKPRTIRNAYNIPGAAQDWPVGADSVLAYNSGANAERRICAPGYQRADLSSYGNGVHLRHDGRAGVFYADGHADTVTAEDLWELDTIHGMFFRTIVDADGSGVGAWPRP